MELRQLEYFVAVAEEANFTRAAERVRISQSGVSAQIQRLERELGATLFDRSSRAIKLTDAGRSMLVHAREALASADAARHAVREVTGLLRGRLVLGMVIGCTLTPLFDALADFHRAHPGVEISLLEGNSDRLVDAVRSGAVDLALVGTAGTAPDELEGLEIVSEGLCALVPHGHAFEGRSGVSLAEIAQYPIVCMPEGTGIRTAFDLACALHEVTPRITLQASAAPAIADLASRGLGTAILSESMAPDFADTLTAITIDDADIPALLSVVWARRPSPALSELVHHIRETFDGPPLDR